MRKREAEREVWLMSGWEDSRFKVDSLLVFLATKTPLKCCTLHNFLLSYSCLFFSAISPSFIFVVIAVSHLYFENDFYVKFARISG